jgi:hypothetical protein
MVDLQTHGLEWIGFMGKPILPVGTIKNPLKEWLRNKKQSNHDFGPFLLNVFTNIN